LPPNDLLARLAVALSSAIYIAVER